MLIYFLIGYCFNFSFEFNFDSGYVQAHTASRFVSLLKYTAIPKLGQQTVFLMLNKANILSNLLLPLLFIAFLFLW